MICVRELNLVGGKSARDWQLFRVPSGLTGFVLSSNGLMYEAVNLEKALANESPDEVAFERVAHCPEGVTAFATIPLPDGSLAFAFGTHDGVWQNGKMAIAIAPVTAMRHDAGANRLVGLSDDGTVWAANDIAEGVIEPCYEVLTTLGPKKGDTRIVFADAGALSLLTIDQAADKFYRQIVGTPATAPADYLSGC